MTKCIRFSGALTSRGYGAKWHMGKVEGAHRVAYCAANGCSIEDIAGWVVRHKCDNPACVNPEHLELGTSADNAADKVERGRWRGRAESRVLTDQDAEDIRRDYVPGNRWHPSPTGQPQLAAKYGVKQSVISQILREITYTTKIITK